jgi:hypothetical protein
MSASGLTKVDETFQQKLCHANSSPEAVRQRQIQGELLAEILECHKQTMREVEADA